METGTKIKRKKFYLGDYIQHGSIDLRFFTCLVAIIIIGLITLYSATYAYAYHYEQGDTAFFFKKQLLWLLLGSVLMAIAACINLEKVKALAAYLGTLVSWGFLILALFMGAHNGTNRHVYILGIQFQPSDVAKLALILFMAYELEKYHNVIVNKKPLQGRVATAVNGAFGKPLFNDSVKIILILGGILIGYAILVVLGSHLSGTLLILFIGVVMLYLGEVRAKWFVVGITGAAVLLFAAWKFGWLAGYMDERITAWLDKSYEPLGARWQINQALYAIGSGGLFGKGLGQSTLKQLYVSEPQTDMIFSIAVEEMGFVTAAIIILLFAILVWRGVVIGINSPTRYGALLSMGIVFLLGMQVVLNIAVATDSVPNTGISLPFFSYGGTAYIIDMVEMGLVLNISRTSNIRRR